MDEARLHDLFAPVGPVSTRRMFGGIGVYRDGMMFALVADDVVYLKADRESGQALEQAGSEPFSYEGKGRLVRTSYWRLPDEAHEDPDRLKEWAERALAAASAAKRAKTPPTGIKGRRSPRPASAP